MLRNLGLIIAACFLLDHWCSVLGSNPESGKFVFFASGNDIYKGQLFDNGSTVPSRLPLSPVGTPYGIDVDIDERLIFWTDRSSGKIKKASIDGGAVTSLATSSSGVRGISIDPFAGEVYWADYSTDSIEMVNYDGTDRRRVLHLPSKDPRAIVVNPDRRELYYTTTARSNNYRRSFSPGVGKVSCDGTNNMTLVSLNSGYYQPMGIALNAEGTRLYWCNHRSSAHNHQIKSSTLSGDDQRTILGTVTYCLGVAWSDEEVYWADQSSQYIGVVGEESGEKRTLGPFPRPRHGPSYYTPRDVFVGDFSSPDRKGWKCTFERGLCGWRRSGDLRWKVQNGYISNSTGPQTDQTNQNRFSRYVLAKTENSADSSIKMATLTSPLINATGSTQKCFRLWHQMSNSARGTLKIYFRDATSAESPKLLWSKFGVQVDEWIGVELAIPEGGVGNVVLNYITSGDVFNSVAIDDVQFGDCKPASKLVCGDASMTVYLDRAKLGISRSDEITFKSGICRGEVYDSETMAITSPYGGCGTTATEGNDTIVFSNQVIVTPTSGIRSSGIEIRVNCSINRDYKVEMSYFANSWIKHIRAEGVGNFSVGIHQYPNEKLIDPYPISSYPQQVEEEADIYMATKLSGNKDLVRSQNTRCWATQSPNPFDPVQRVIIQDGCPASGSVKVLSSNNANFLPFLFKAFSFTEELTLVYVHCDVIVCQQGGDPACDSDCTSSRPKRDLRQRRDLRSGPHTVSQGPFISKGPAAEAKGDPQAISSINIVLLLTACACVLVSAFVVVYARIKIQQRHLMIDQNPPSTGL